MRITSAWQSGGSWLASYDGRAWSAVTVDSTKHVGSYPSLDFDINGDAYEGLLAKGASDKGSGAGQYFTPRALIQAIVDVVDPGVDDRVTDP